MAHGPEVGGAPRAPTVKAAAAPVGVQSGGWCDRGSTEGGRREGHLLFPNVHSCLFLNAGLAGTGVPAETPAIRRRSGNWDEVLLPVGRKSPRNSCSRST